MTRLRRLVSWQCIIDYLAEVCHTFYSTLLKVLLAVRIICGDLIVVGKSPIGRGPKAILWQDLPRSALGRQDIVFISAVVLPLTSPTGVLLGKI